MWSTGFNIIKQLSIILKDLVNDDRKLSSSVKIGYCNPKIKMCTFQPQLGQTVVNTFENQIKILHSTSMAIKVTTKI